MSRQLPTVEEAEAVLGRRNPMTIPEVAEWFGVSKRLVNDWTRDPEVDLRVMKLGKRLVRVDVREVVRLMRAMDAT